MAPINLIENRDYTVRRDGAWVFTREYLLARGHCCDSKCLNCPYEHGPVRDVKTMRPVISMVPSWTETLIHAGANVVGRTRFCIHPEASVASITVLGGTKTLSSDFEAKMTRLVSESEASGHRLLVVLDREENPKEFVELFSKFTVEIIDTHVSDFSTLANDTRNLEARFLGATPSSENDSQVSQRLASFARRIGDLIGENAFGSRKTRKLQGFIKSEHSQKDIENALNDHAAVIYYFIWRNPWMIVRSDTWIGATLKSCFPSASLPTASSRYTEIAEKNLEDEIGHGTNANAILLFSSEPYPFEKSWSEIQNLPFVKKARVSALVDGECFSWFGIRSIRFLEDVRL
jgi:hypothetical protein